MTEIGELSVEQYQSLTSAASQARNNAFLQRATTLHGSRHAAIEAARWFSKLLDLFAERFGKDGPICLYESPGRVNLMGMHIDHRGGIVNPVATRERIRAVCRRREDDLLQARSLYGAYGEGQLCLSDRLPTKPLESLADWLRWSESQALPIRGGKDFINYFACGPLYAACFCYPWGRRFRGAEFLLDSDLPPSAGLSSSSALVVLATDFFLRCNDDTRGRTIERLLEIYGYGEWYIGTRGGTGDHAAIKLCQRGSIQPLITTPSFRAGESAPIPNGYDLVMYQSGDEANKSVEPFKTGFNAPIVAYQAGELMLMQYLQNVNRSALKELLIRRAGMDVKHHRVYLGDVVNEGLLSEEQQYEFLRSLPRVMTWKDIATSFKNHDSFKDVQATRDPPGGYRIRDVNAFGLGECSRARVAPGLLAEGDIQGFAEMMNVSQFGDRVSDLEDAASRRIKHLEDETLCAMSRERFPLRAIAGDYHVSTPNVDRLASICLSCPDVLGARLSGAGLGGMLIVLGREGFEESLDPILHRDYYEPLKKEFRKIRIVPSAGAGFY